MRWRSDPFEILGVSKDASPAQIRNAYRVSALKCHPDRCPDDPASAARRFHILTDAYQAALRTFGPSSRGIPRGRRTWRPADFARMDNRWRHCGTWDVSQRPGPFSRRYSRATVNETKVFVCLWCAAIVIGVLSATLACDFALSNSGSDEHGVLAFVKVSALAGGIYAAIVAGSVLFLVVSRRVVWLTIRLKLKLLPALAGDCRKDSRRDG